jgi:hypothetical protein
MKSTHKDRYGKTLYRLEKPRARNYCLIQESEDDDWFIYVRKLDIKTHKETDSSMIIAKDVPQWLDGLERTGWVQKDII